MVSKNVSYLIVILILTVALIITFMFSEIYIDGSASTIPDSSAWSNGCATAISQGCPITAFQSAEEGGLVISKYDPDSDGKDDTLRVACERTQGVTTAETCRAKCCG